jgi:peptidoglycan biosynthesis protein MviN/MurJ (putative lipid II flippase)
MVGFLVLAIPLSKALGAPGIGLANSLAYTGEAILLFIILSKTIPFFPRLKGTLLRTIGASITGVGLSLLLQSLPLPSGSVLINLIISSSILLLAVITMIPWLIPEIKDLLNT